jgi:hypothetical protein
LWQPPHLSLKNTVYCSVTERTILAISSPTMLLRSMGAAARSMRQLGAGSVVSRNRQSTRLRPLTPTTGRRWLCSASGSSSQPTRVAIVQKPSSRQLVTLAIASGLPFVGFGFADNAIMILVGDRIDASLGVRFGLSTLAAAGLGNLISDVVGISLGEVIEAWVARIITAPPLAREYHNTAHICAHIQPPCLLSCRISLA